MRGADWVLHILSIVLGVWMLVDLYRDRKGAPLVRLVVATLACLMIGLACGGIIYSLTR